MIKILTLFFPARRLRSHRLSMPMLRHPSHRNVSAQNSSPHISPKKKNTNLINIPSCYNNCPNDSRAPAATASMNQACSNASIHATTTKVSSTIAPMTTTSSDAPNPTDVPTNSVTFSADSPAKTNGVAGNAAGILAAVAGAVVAVL